MTSGPEISFSSRPEAGPWYGRKWLAERMFRSHLGQARVSQKDVQLRHSQPQFLAAGIGSGVLNAKVAASCVCSADGLGNLLYSSSVTNLTTFWGILRH